MLLVILDDLVYAMNAKPEFEYQIVGDALNCFDGLDAVFCLTLPSGEFRWTRIHQQEAQKEYFLVISSQ